MCTMTQGDVLVSNGDLHGNKVPLTSLQSKMGTKNPPKTLKTGFVSEQMGDMDLRDHSHECAAVICWYVISCLIAKQPITAW